MWKNYLKVAFRNLMRYKIFSFINIFGLGVSMALSLIVITLVLDQYKYDRHNTQKERIFRVNTLSEKYKPSATTTMALKEALLNEVPGVEKVGRIKRGFGNLSMMDFKQDVNIPITGYFADPEILQIFEFELESGNPATALKDPYSVVLTREIADKLFKNSNPIGESIKVGNQGEYKVTGILKDKPDQKSHVMFEGLASFATLKSLNPADSTGFDPLQSWKQDHEGYLYMLLQEETSSEQVQAQLHQIAKDHYAADDPNKHDFSLQNLADIALGPDINNPIGPFLPRIFVIFLSALAAIVMLTSCFNYTNLSIARSLTRAKEIGIRKVTGAARYQIFFQFITEAILTSGLALAFSWILVILSKPYLLNFRLVQLLRWDFSTSLEVYPYLIGFAVLVGLMAGFFPAVVLSSLQPIRVLKNFGSIRLLSRFGLRKALLVMQFAISLIFIVSAILVYRQTNLFLNKDRGFAVDDKVLIKLNQTDAEEAQSRIDPIQQRGKRVCRVSYSRGRSDDGR
jgi:putative ABC transport system permease protein